MTNSGTTNNSSTDGVAISNGKVVKNSIFVTGSVGIGGVMLFFVMIAVARYLGVEDYGQFSVFLTVISIIQLFADGGMVNITIREIATNKEKLCEFVGSTTLGLLCISGMLMLATTAYVMITGMEQQYDATLLIMLAAAFVAMHSLVYGAALRAMEDMHVTALVAILQKFVLIGAIGLCIYFDAGIIGVAAAHLFANLFQLIYTMVAVNRRYGKVRYRFDLKHWLRTQGEALPLGAAMVLRKVTVHLDIIILTALSTLIAVGLYSSAYRILQMIEVAVIGFSGVLFPVFSQLAQTDRERLQHMFNTAVIFLLFAAMPLAAWFVLSAENLMLIFYGQQYQAAYDVLQVLAVALIFLIPSSLFNPMFAAIHRQKILMVIAVSGLVANGLLDVLFIPQFHQLGAAIGTAFTEMVVCCLGIYSLYVLGVRFRCWWKAMRIALCALGAGTAYYFLPDNQGIVPEIFRSLVFALVYLGAISLVRVYSKSDVQSLFPRKPRPAGAVHSG